MDATISSGTRAKFTEVRTHSDSAAHMAPSKSTAVAARSAGGSAPTTSEYKSEPRQPASDVESARTSRDEQRDRAYRREVITTYWFMVGFLAISLYGAIGVTLAMAFTR